jgi:hypothetical protein
MSASSFFKNIRGVEAMGIQNGVGERGIVLIHHLDEGNALEGGYPVILILIPADRFQAVGHALGRFHKEHGRTVRAFVKGCAKIREARRLETGSLNGAKFCFHEESLRFFKCSKRDGHG